MAEKDSFSTERFIAEIQSRPAIWDIESEEYTNRDLRKMAWDEITDIFSKEGDTMEQKNELGRSFQRKWKSLRDCYSRERHRLQRLKTGSAVRKTQYVYFNQLSFLSCVVKPRSLINSMDEGDPVQSEEDTSSMIDSAIDPFHPSTSDIPLKRMKLEQNSPEDTSHLVDLIQANILSREEMEKSREDDDDRLFLLSLLNPMKRLPEQVRLSIRTQFSQIIENASRECFAIPDRQVFLSSNSFEPTQTPSRNDVVSNNTTRSRSRKTNSKFKTSNL